MLPRPRVSGKSASAEAGLRVRCRSSSALVRLGSPGAGPVKLSSAFLAFGSGIEVRAAGETAPGEEPMKRLSMGCAVLAFVAAGSVADAQQPAPQTVQAPSNNGIASAQYSQDPDLRCDLLEVRRVSGGALLVRWRVINTAGGGSSGLTATAAKPIRYDFGWNELFFIDPAENK